MIIVIIFNKKGCPNMANMFYKIDIILLQLSHDISFLGCTWFCLK